MNRFERWLIQLQCAGHSCLRCATYVADVASSLPRDVYSTSGGLFRLAWRACKGHALTLRLRTLFLFVPQPVAACLRAPPPGSGPPCAHQGDFAGASSPCTYLAAKWKIDSPHIPANHLHGGTCLVLFAAAWSCRNCCVCANLLVNKKTLLVQWVVLALVLREADKPHGPCQTPRRRPSRSNTQCREASIPQPTASCPPQRSQSNSQGLPSRHAQKTKNHLPTAVHGQQGTTDTPRISTSEPTATAYHPRRTPRQSTANQN